MKKLFCFLICLIMFTPILGNAKEYTISETDMSIVIDNEKWYVFTRDNIKDNEELAFLNVSEDYMNEFMKENSVYLDAIIIEENGDNVELFVRKAKGDTINNLSNFKNSKVKELAKELAKDQKDAKYNVFESKYKYAHLEYKDGDFYIDEYYTIVNKDNYTITAQSTKNLTDNQKEMIKEIIKTIDFKVNKKLKDDKSSINWKTIIIYTVVGGLVGGVFGGIQQIINNKKRVSK